MVRPEKSNRLLKVYSELQTELENLLPNIDKREYMPHITLVREVKYSGETVDFISGVALDHQFEVAGISLMESTRINGKLTYIRRAFEPFKPN